MSDSSFSTVLEAPRESFAITVFAADNARTAAPASAASLRITGVLDGRQRNQVRSTVDVWCAAPPAVPFSAFAHLDLSDATEVDAIGLDLLNEAYVRLHATGWGFRVTAPVSIEARIVFNQAAIDHDLLWA